MTDELQYQATGQPASTAPNQQGFMPGHHPDLPPPIGTVGFLGWLRQNLFSSLSNTVLTLAILGFLVYMIPPIANWVAFDSVVSGGSKQICEAGRLASGLNRTIVATDLSNGWTETVGGQADQAEAYLRQAASKYDDFGPEAAPPELYAAMERMDPAGTQTALKEAIAAKDAEAVAGLFAHMAPLSTWGAANDGACWALVDVRLNQFIYGFYPNEEYWRVNLTFLLLVVAVVIVLWDKTPYRKQLVWFSLAFPVIAFFLLYGGVGDFLPAVETSMWGGLMLTMVIGITGIVASLPIGIVLALGRRSNMPIIRVLCVCFIEFIRGVPLITILFMSSVMLPLFLPEGVNFDKLLRALIGVALFSSAYMAEVIRGGLQAIPKGQYEGAMSLGLGYWKMMRLVILPQALKIVIPGIVNTFIGLFKDTTLVLIIGLFDLLGIAKAAITDATWIGLSTEAYLFVAFVFFCFCFSMSRYSIYLEKKLHTGHKR